MYLPNFRMNPSLFLMLFQIGAINCVIAQPRNPRDMEPVKITTRQYHTGAEERSITLWRQRIPRPSDSELLSFLTRHPGQTAFPNVAFLVVVSDPGDFSKGQIAFAAYIYINEKGAPQPTWNADITQSSSIGLVHLVLVKSVAEHAEFRVYSVPVEQKLGGFPVNLDSVAFDRWPRANASASIFKMTLSGRNISGISEVHVTSGGNILSIQAIRDLAGGPPVVLNFDTATSTWSQVEPSGSGKEGTLGEAGKK